MNDTPTTLIEAVRYFSDLRVCFEAMLQVKWPDGKVICPKCGGDKIGVVKSRLLLQCKASDCRKQFSVKVGTFAEDSAIPLGLWLFGVWLLANRISLSTPKIAELLGTYQRTAWHMMHKLRLAKEIAEMNDEQWRPIPGFEGHYEVSDFGNVRSVQRQITQRGPHGETVTRTIGGRLLSQKRRGQNGYCEVTLKAIRRGVKSQVCLVHRLVLEAFIGPCPEGQQARHFPDRRCTNNRLDNLQWGTPKANQADRIIHGTTVNGERSHLARLSAAQVRDIRRRLANGEKIRAVAQSVGIDEATVGHIKHRRSWKSLV